MDSKMSETQNRISPPDPEAATPRQKALMEQVIAQRGKLLTPYKIWLHAPGVAEGLEALGTFLNKNASLSKKELQVVILSTVVHWKSPYPIKNHVKHSRNADLPEEIINAILEGRPVETDDARLGAIARMTATALAAEATPDDAFEAYVATLGREAIAEILALIGYFTAVALALRFHDVQPSP